MPERLSRTLLGIALLVRRRLDFLLDLASLPASPVTLLALRLARIYLRASFISGGGELAELGRS